MSKIPGQIPQYKKLYEKLRQQILKGAYMPGDILPSENDLFEKYRVTQPVIRQALAMLVSEGLIKKHQGKGSIVQSRPVGVGIKSLDGKDLTSHSDDSFETHILQKPRKIAWPQDMFISPDETDTAHECILLERLRTVNNEIVFFERFFIPDALVPDIAKHKLENRSFYELLALQYNISVVRSEQQFLAVEADQKIARLLKTKPRTPLIRLERKLETNKNGLSIYSSLFAVTNKYILYSQS